MTLSIVIPVYNEEENVEELHQRLVDALEGSGHAFEVLFVDDGSRDRTVEVLRCVGARDPRLRIVKLRRNYGQTPSMRAGIDHARGDVIVTMDGDLQNDPKDIVPMVRRLEEGFDLVAGWRRNRRDPVLRRTLPSKIANWLIHRVTRVPIHDNGCSLKVYRASVIRSTPLYSEMHRFIPAMVAASGGRIAEVVVTHHPRTRGQSKYGLSRTGKVILDLLTIKMILTFSQRPLHWFAILALPFALIAALSAAAFLATLGVGEAPSVVFPAIAVLFGYLAFHFVAVGLLGELVVRAGNPFRFRTWEERWRAAAPDRGPR